METGKNFKQLLLDAGINQTQLSQAIGISTTSISKWHKIGVPKYAVAYLTLLAKYKRLLENI
ncbi:transcriptional regulator [Neisseria weixii]|uniref:Transcriptional regulator n=1 Tax=Neisseria weixii TaxID=1853276 RepID=A0A3N4N245_9NEIS|nr:helix-turn-helix transcriptional regulator [Neisseria weixii]RPD86285.1 transcriptional regulator [Neisseria weixii]RPD89395.1 transcriptional regulator [Neisseria weixii]